jgi:hypothetical protein
VLVADPHHERLDQLARQPPVGRVGEQQLAAGALGGAALVDVQVRAARADDRLPGLGERLDRQHVGGRAVEHRERPRAGAEMLAETLLHPRGPAVRPVGGGVPAAGGDDGRHRLGQHAGLVVAREAALVRHSCLNSRYAGTNKL